VTVVLVALGAMVGAPVRYLVDRAMQARYGTDFPWGTLVVNVAGSFVLGLVWQVGARHGVSPALLALLGTGFCGALTTYSTFGFETVRLIETGRRRRAAANVAGSVVAGLAAAFAGGALATLLW